MPFTKYASLESAEVLGVKGSQERIHTASLDKFAEFDDYRTEDGFLYARIRAISSRVNKNHDGWPSIELAGSQELFDRHTAAKGGFTVEADKNAQYGYSTFLGKPVFVDHHNSNPERARGVVVDSKLHVEDFRTAGELDAYYSSAPDNHLPPAWVELLLEVDADSFPKLAKAIINGSKDSSTGIDGFSMGCDVEKSVCNICKNAATNPDEYCEHVKLKGAHFDYIDPKTGRKTSKKSYEDCYGIKFFEISAVFDPADETALLRDLIHKEGRVSQSDLRLPEAQHSGPAFARTARTADLAQENPLPQSELTKAPEDVNTLRQESLCPVCGSSMDEETCEICGYTRPPEGFDNPNLQQHQMNEMGQQPPGQQTPDQQLEQPQSQPTDLSNPTNVAPTAHVNRDWIISHPKMAGKINVKEQPILSDPSPATDEPKEEILQDESQPTTARTAKEYLATVGRIEQEKNMSKKQAAEPLPAARPDTRVDLEGVGGVDQASNEQASKADAQTEVEGKGATPVTDVSAEQENVNVDQGDEYSKNIETIPTKTWSGTEGQTDPVQGDTFPSEKGQGSGRSSRWQITALDAEPFPKEDGGLSGGNAEQGTQPADPVGKADDRVDVLQPTTTPNNNSGPTTTWSGTDGNGVTRQQDPVTRETLEGDDIVNIRSSKHLFSAFKLADLEVKLGLMDEDRKFERVAELEEQHPAVVEASLKYAQRVRTAGLSKGGEKVARRLPSFAQPSETVKKEASTDSEEGDSLLFWNG
jgi:hypothetical protein